MDGQGTLAMELLEASFGLTKEELAWMAGFVDGEGAIMISRPRLGVWHLTLAVAQTSPGVLYWYKKVFGGSINFLSPEHIRAKGAVGRYTWQVIGKKARATLKVLLPFMRVKREQARIGIAFQDFYGAAAGSVLCEVKARQFQRQMRTFGGHYKREGGLNEPVCDDSLSLVPPPSGAKAEGNELE